MGISGGPNTVRDSSLVLELDAADRNSYQSGSTTWFDLTPNNITGSTSGSNTFPVYSISNNGSLVFNGINSVVDCGNPSVLQITSGSINIWFRGVQTNFLS